jgi:hypothetical protein
MQSSVVLPLPREARVGVARLWLTAALAAVIYVTMTAWLMPPHLLLRSRFCVLLSRGGAWC